MSFLSFTSFSFSARERKYFWWLYEITDLNETGSLENFDLILRSGDLSLINVNFKSPSLYQPTKSEFNCLKILLFLTEHFSNSIYRRVSGRDTAKNPDSYKFVQENLDM